jgi:hypothetical protein
MEFAAALRRELLRRRPAVVAVELPQFLSEKFEEAVARLPEISVLLYSDPQDEERAIFVPVEPADPFVEAVRTAREIGAQLLYLEPQFQERPHLPDRYPDTAAIARIGLERYVDAYRVYPQPRSVELSAHAAAMAWKLQGADPELDTVIVVSLNLLDPLLDAMQTPQDPPPIPERGPVELRNLHPDCLGEVTVEYPFLQERYEFFRMKITAEIDAAAGLDRARTQVELLREASAEYERNTGERIHHWQRRLFARYTRNLAQMSGDLVAGIYDLTVAARGVADDNFAWEMWRMASRYQAQTAESDRETLNLSGSEIWWKTRKIRIRRRLPRARQSPHPAFARKRKTEDAPGAWARQTTGEAICSYPPEDLVIEEFGRFLRQKAKSMLSEERVRVEPFTTSLFDGIDIRETIRNWHRRKLYVRRYERLAGEIGALIVIFDEDREGRYTYCTTWLGENQNESDMAFYSTDPFAHLVGPGIGRAEYGGLLMTLPPRRMYDVWGDESYDFAESKPERLLMAGLDYSVERYVVYVAARPPRSVFRSIAAHLNRKILFVPIGQMSPTRLKRLRVVHVLDGYDRREIAKDYIW